MQKAYKQANKMASRRKKLNFVNTKHEVIYIFHCITFEDNFIKSFANQSIF